MHLLLVDDEPSLLHLLGQHLVRQGHTVESAASVAGARVLIPASSLNAAVFDAAVFDAAVIDWTLPDGTGLDIGCALLEGHPNIHVVFTSGYPLDIAVVPADLRARVHVLQKPFLPRALAEILKSL